jgi:N-acetylglucosamine-6-sulfatase
LDEAIEQVVDKLKATGEWDNTVLVFTSDNAFGLGQHRVKAKNMPYDAFLRVPMIVSGRGLKARFDPAAADGTIVDSPLTVTTIDIAATAVSLAEATPGRTLDGIDMLRPRLNPDFGPRGHRAVLIESGWTGDERSDVNKFVGIRTDRWRWFGWDALPIGGTLTFNVLGRFTRSIEFYDRRVDPAQLNNIHGAAHADVEERMRRMVQQRFDCQGRECV